MKIIIKFLVTIFLVLTVAEIFGRLVIGLGDPVLFEFSKEYGYRIKPNQHIVRFGKRIMINEQGLRNGPVREFPEEGVLRVLCVGDSIMNGSEKTDQSLTIPYLLKSSLEKKGISCETLNASSKGWTITNEAGYIRGYGVYNSQIVIWLINDRDIMERPIKFEDPGAREEFPVKKPVFAMTEVIKPAAARLRGLFRRIGSRFSPKKKSEDGDPVASMRQMAIDYGLIPADSDENDYSRLRSMLWNERIRVRDDEVEAIRSVAASAKALGTKLTVVYLDTPKATRYRPADENYVGDEIYVAGLYKAAVTGEGGAFIDITGDLKKAGYNSIFRDDIHPNEKGNAVIAESIARAIESMVHA